MSDKDTYLKKGELSYQKRDFKEAITWFSKALKIDSNDADLYSTRGVAHFHSGNLPASLQDMNTSQSLEPNSPYRYASRAYIKDAMGDTHGAIIDYQKTIELDPEDAIALNNLGMLEEKLGHQVKAQTLFKFADDLTKRENSTPETFERPTNIQKEINEKRQEQSLSTEIKKVFTSKSAFKEFISFVKNGFKK